MPKYRQLHTKIIDSYDFSEMPNDFTRVFWILLIVVVDSEGRAIDNPAWLRSRMFPLRSDVELDSISQAIDWLAERGMIHRYEVSERQYFYVVNFMSYQSGTEREARSVLPAPLKGDIEDQSTHEELLSNSREGPEEDSISVSASASAIDLDIDIEKRENNFRIYENEIGILTPLISDEIKAAENEFPPGWIGDALREASRVNKRSWKYALAILKRWKVDGKVDKPRTNGRRYGPPSDEEVLAMQQKFLYGE